ncbi:TMP-TENI-domain-containing protein [Wallemia mellicola]|uniref:TMP-TENI-domain-containing protein n=1 Tax=Wallemia mellicola TaxID=1708541 RepID=A0A4T0TWE7_9BASI|nr:TMP-TENI-domain-containing protein [Wallemia mellicola]TIC63006.1 TMP-TENI-domain-containing protein [Wallemia mellicola]TIC66724.1 TMP-TENI-domain-containing protein [Wallemia mellicola]TIC69664.1 TMP-TENI-domain-containing protein [Wallemia mellicola]
MKTEIDYSVYLVTARGLLPEGKDYLESLEESLQGGVTVVQLREKTTDTGEFIQVAQSTKDICDKYNVPLLINDRIDVALAIDCAGVHVGQSDAPLSIARKLLGDEKVIGVSAGNIEQAINAQNGGADYIGIGAVYGTQTKDVTNKIMGTPGARSILAALDPQSPIKTVVIGGIKSENLLRVLNGVHEKDTKRYLDGVAVVSEIVSSKNPREAASNLSHLIKSFRESEKIKYHSASYDVDSIVQEAWRIINAIPEQHPLIQQMANIVTANDQANATLALGASPVMAAVVGDQKDLNPHIGALLINMGTVSEEQKQAMLVGGRYSNLNKKPLIFDPVALGATSFRKQTGQELLNHWAPTVIKGNAAEIGALSGLTEVATKGVDSVGPGFRNPVTVVKSLANRERCIVVMTGKDDYISDGERTVKISNGHSLLGQITGSGCVTGTAIATCCAVSSMTTEDMNEDGKLSRGDHFMAAIAGVLALEIAAEIASKRDDVRGPNTFRSAWIDEMSKLNEINLKKLSCVTLT